ncbi:hypothetical protein DFH29DRAFT_872810 [Suillus ampliporus]|nr:hypothetical protein DFH29DRAFT_872810 [Suillus ampliporus]
MSSSQNAPSRRRIVRDVPIVRQAGLNIAGHSLADQVGCASEMPESMNTPELPPRINPPPVFSHDGYSSMPPNHQDGDTASRYRMVYTYMPLRGAEKSRQEYTDGVIYRDATTGIQKSTTRRYQLPPVRPPRESLTADSEITPIATSSTSASSASTITAARTGRRRGERQHDSLGAAAAVPVIDKAQVKSIVKDAKDYVIVKTLTTPPLTDACSSVIAEDHLVKLWTDENISSLYKTIITPMSTLLNRFKQCTQDLVENLYKLRMSIWTDPTVQADHNKSTVEFLIGNNSLNFIFGDPVRLEDGREVCFPFEHEAIIQIASRAAFCDGYDKFIKSDHDLDNIMAISGTAACCGLQEFMTGIFKQLMCFHQSNACATEVIPVYVDTLLWGCFPLQTYLELPACPPMASSFLPRTDVVLISCVLCQSRLTTSRWTGVLLDDNLSNLTARKGSLTFSTTDMQSLLIGLSSFSASTPGGWYRATLTSSGNHDTCCFGINSFTGNGLSDVQSWLYFSADPLQMLGLCFVFTRSKVPYILKEDDTKFLGDGYEFVSGKDEMIVEGKAGYGFGWERPRYFARVMENSPVMGITWDRPAYHSRHLFYEERRGAVLVRLSEVNMLVPYTPSIDYEEDPALQSASASLFIPGNDSLAADRPIGTQCDDHPSDADDKLDDCGHSTEGTMSWQRHSLKQDLPMLPTSLSSVDWFDDEDSFASSTSDVESEGYDNINISTTSLVSLWCGHLSSLAKSKSAAAVVLPTNTRISELRRQWS